MKAMVEFIKECNYDEGQEVELIYEKGNEAILCIKPNQNENFYYPSLFIMADNEKGIKDFRALVSLEVKSSVNLQPANNTWLLYENPINWPKVRTCIKAGVYMVEFIEVRNLECIHLRDAEDWHNHLTTGMLVVCLIKKEEERS